MQPIASQPAKGPDDSRSQEARAWFDGPLGQQLLGEERRLLADELARFFGGFLVHYGPPGELPAQRPQIQRCVSLGPALPGVEIVCEEHCWPLGEHAADVVLLQHALDFSRSPHALLREAARSVRPGGHLLIVGFNPWSTWGARSLVAGDGLGQVRGIGAARATDWMNLLGFALEKRRLGCYRPPLSSLTWQRRLARMEPWGERWQLPGAGCYLLVARKLVVGLRPLPKTERARMGKLLPMPVAKVSRRDSEQ